MAEVGVLTAHMFFAQGIDLEAGGRNKKVWRTAPKSENVYLKLLVKVRGVEPFCCPDHCCSRLIRLSGIP